MDARRSGFLWKLFASYSVAVIATAAVVALLIDRRLEGALVSELETNLRDECHLLGPYALRALREGAGEGEALQSEFEGLGEGAQMRLTLIRHDGVVLADSHEDPLDMENHGSRPEVLEAAASGLGVSRRFSHSVGYPMLYVARALPGPAEPAGFVRLSIPLSDVEAQRASVRAAVVLGAGIGLVFALALGFFFAQRTTRPIAEMTRVAEAMRQGRYEERSTLHRDDQIGLLADTLNQLGGEITRRIATISQDDAQLRAMLAVMVEGVIAVDEEDRVAFMNHAAHEHLGLEVEDPVGRSLWELAPIGELEELVVGTRSARAPGRRQIEMFRQGREQVIEAHTAPFQGGGRSGQVVVLHDVSDLRRLERIRRDFVANVSHELKTPLTSIKGFVETLLGGALHDDENNERFLQRIDANVDRLSHLVSDLLSLARIESPDEAVQLVHVDWRAIVDDVHKRHEALLRRKGLAWSVRGSDQALLVRGDPEAMTQVLDNLVDNAIKYTPARGSVSVGLGEEDGVGVLTVADTGLGVPPEELERIFERFYRVDRARSRELGGTGLGLSIVKHLVRSMGGDVRVESELGVGSRFSISLPLARAKPEVGRQDARG